MAYCFAVLSHLQNNVQAYDVSASADALNKYSAAFFIDRTFDCLIIGTIIKRLQSEYFQNVYMECEAPIQFRINRPLYFE